MFLCNIYAVNFNFVYLKHHHSITSFILCDRDEDLIRTPNSATIQLVGAEYNRQLLSNEREIGPARHQNKVHV